MSKSDCFLYGMKVEDETCIGHNARDLYYKDVGQHENETSARVLRMDKTNHFI